MSKIINRMPDDYMEEIEWIIRDHPIYQGNLILERKQRLYKINKQGKMLPSTLVVVEDSMPITARDIPALRSTVLAASTNHDQLNLERVMKD